MTFEKALGSLLGFDDKTRVELVQVSSPNEVPTLELRMTRDGGELGWLPQRRIRLAAGQIGALRNALNLMDLDAQNSRTLARPRDEDSNVIDLTTLSHSS